MAFATSCPHCNAIFQASAHHAGKKGKCPKCSKLFIVEKYVEKQVSEVIPEPEEEYEDDSWLDVEEPEPEKTWVPPKVSSTPIATGNKAKREITWKLIAVCASCFVVGFFSGQEYLKYRMRTMLTSAAESALKQAFSVPGDSVALSEKVPEKPRKTLSIGEEFKTDGYSVRLESAEITLPAVMRWGDKMTPKSEYLVLNALVSNLSDRKVMKSRPNGGMNDYYTIKDDVENNIRPVNFGFSTYIEGSQATSDVDPGSSVKQIEAFQKPLGKTKSITLRIDLSAYGDEGFVDFVIPSTQIKGF